MTVYTVYNQIAEIISALAPTKILALRATDEMQARLENLIERLNYDFTLRETK